MFRRTLTFLGVAVVLLCLNFARAENTGAPNPPKNQIYNGDPNHLWNRLHRSLFVRTAADGTEYGFDHVDPLLWSRTKYLLEGPSHENAIKVLDEFLAKNGETLIRTPLKRAILQRDLWAVFDWAARGAGHDSPHTTARKALQRRLATAIQRLALTKEQIASLPDNYAAAAKSGKFQKEYNHRTPKTPFLPVDLFSTNGSWVCVGLGHKPMALTHVSFLGGRSAFVVFMRTPGGREETIDYLKKLREFQQPYSFEPDRFVTNRMAAVLTTNLPQFPGGTTFALVRQVMLVSADGRLVPAPLTENVQMRHYRDMNPGSPDEAQSLFEVVLSRQQLFDKQAGGLRAVENENVFRQFMDKGFDPFEETESKGTALSAWTHRAFNCIGCHSRRGVYSVNSLLHRFQQMTLTLPQVMAVHPQDERDAVRQWKQTQFNWGLLQGLWEQK